MNKIFKVIWNHATQSWTVVSELSKAHKKQSSVKQVAKLSVLAASLVTVSGVMAAESAKPVITAYDRGGLAIGTDHVSKQSLNGATQTAGATVTAYDGIAIGNGSHSGGENGQNGGNGHIAIGLMAKATGSGAAISQAAVALGSYSSALGGSSTALGQQAYAGIDTKRGSYQNNGNFTTAVGAEAKAMGQSTTALGMQAQATYDRATALGRSAQATSNHATAVGTSAAASKQATVALGTFSKADNDFAIAIGGATTSNPNRAGQYQAAKASGNSSISIGIITETTGSNAIAIGRESAAKSNHSVAIGYKASSTNSQYATAIGSESAASAQFAFAAGPKSIANIQDGVALGSNSKTTVDKSVKGFDQNTTTRNARSVLNTYTPLTGNVLTSTRAGVSVGSNTDTRQINNLAAGKADTDAVNVAQLKSVNLQIAGDTTEKKGADVRLWDQGLTVKGENNSFISTKADNNTITIGTKKADVTVADGKAVAPTTKNEGVVTGSELASTVNSLYWTATADRGNAAKVHAGAKVKFESADPSKLTIEQTGTDDNAVIKFTPKFTLALPSTDAINEIKGDQNVHITPDTTDNKKVTIGLSPNIKVDSVKAGDKTVLSNGKLTGLDSHIAAPTETVTTTPESLDAKKNEAATVEDVLNAGWNLQANDKGVDAVTHADTVNFTSKDNSVVITPNTDGKKTTLDFSVKAADSTLTVGADGVKVNTGSLVNASTAEDDANRGKVTVNAGDENKVATVKNVADAINSAAWTVKVADSQEAIETSTANDKGASVSAGTTVTHTAGKNLKVKRDGNNVTYALANDVSVNTVTTEKATVGKGDAATTISTSKAGDNVTEVKFGDNAGKPVRVTNVANGVKDGDAVNVRQLNDAKANINQNTQAIGKLNDKIDQVEKRGRKGTAIAGAIGMIPQPHTSGKSMVGVATTNYRGEQAVAVGYSRLSDNGKHIIKLSGSSNVSGKKDAMVGAAYGFQW